MRRGKFNLGSFKNLTCDMGFLIPIQVHDVIAGDTFKGASQVFMRMTPMLAPIMHPIYIRVHHFFVPYRLIWDDFEEFITKNNVDLQVPKVKVKSVAVGSLLDYLGIPPFEAKDTDYMLFNSLPLRAYQLIYNEFFRDQDLHVEIEVDTSTTLDDATPANLQQVSWHKDYFTIARPWEQKGEEVTIPVYSSGLESSDKYYQLVVSMISTDIEGDTAYFERYGGFQAAYGVFSEIFNNHKHLLNRFLQVANSRSDVLFEPFLFSLTDNGINPGSWTSDSIRCYCTCTYKDGTSPGFKDWTLEPLQSYGSVYSLTSNTVSMLGSISITDVRMGIAQQRLRERKAKFGSEYRDLLASMGVRYTDARLQLPEFITGSSSLFRTSEVIQTGAGDAPVGSLRGYGVGFNKTNGFKRYFPEHGIFMSLMSIIPLNMYSDGVPRYFLKSTADDFLQREIAQLVPMQEIYNSELYVRAGWRNDLGLEDNTYFGFIDRYEEYRYAQSSVAGEFRTFYKDWHLARMFDAQPALNGDFLRCNPSKRIFAEQTQHSIIIMAQNMLRARRILPQFAKSGAL